MEPLAPVARARPARTPGATPAASAISTAPRSPARDATTPRPAAPLAVDAPTRLPSRAAASGDSSFSRPYGPRRRGLSEPSAHVGQAI